MSNFSSATYKCHFPNSCRAWITLRKIVSVLLDIAKYLRQWRHTVGMPWCIYLFGAVQLWHVIWALLDTRLEAVGSIFLRVLHCLLFATTNLIADGAACQCVQCHSFFTKKGEKKTKKKPCCSRRPQCILRHLQSAIHCTLQPFV